LHYEIQAIFLLITRRADLAIVFFSLLFFPGVLLHELSHYVTARLLRVQTGKISLIPRTKEGGKLQMGSVETVQTDFLRDALIGMAPLIVGGLVVAYIGLVQMGLIDVWQAYESGGFAFAWDAFTDLFSGADFWLWFYLAFAVSSTMFPSAMDRRAWLPLLLVLLILIVLALIFGAGPWMVENLASPLNRVLLAIDVVFGISLFIHIFLFVPLFLLRMLIARLSGYKIVTGKD